MKQKRLKKWVLEISLCILVWMVSNAVYAQEVFPPGSKLPPFNLKMPDSSEVRTYLGIKDIKTFSLSQIPARFLIIEFFSVFCVKCQGNVPTINRLYQVIRDDPELNKEMKMIGVGLLSGTNEIVLFKEKFKTEYPLFADPKGDIQERTRINFVPLTLVTDPDGKIIMSHSGIITDLDAFLIELRKKCKSR